MLVDACCSQLPPGFFFYKPREQVFSLCPHHPMLLNHTQGISNGAFGSLNKHLMTQEHIFISLWQNYCTSILPFLSPLHTSSLVLRLCVAATDFTFPDLWHVVPFREIYFLIIDLISVEHGALGMSSIQYNTH